MKKLWNKIKHWFWWNFKATDNEKTRWQMMVYGTGIMKCDKFVDIKKFWTN